MRHLRIIAAMAAGLLVVVLMPLTAGATHSWNGYHWERSSNPVALELGDNLSNNWKSYLATASTDWSVSTVLDTTVVPGSAKGRCKTSGGRIEICNDRYGDNGWLGMATISTSGDHITKGNVKLNDTYFNTTFYDTPAWRNTVMCHEVGHLFGLGHNDEEVWVRDVTGDIVYDDNDERIALPSRGTCMDYAADPVPNQHPDAHDYDLLEAVYTHLDVDDGGGGDTGGGGGGPPGGCKGGPKKCGYDDSAGGSWGKLVSIEAGGAGSTYVMDLGNGKKKVTHITWAQ